MTNIVEHVTAAITAIFNNFCALFNGSAEMYIEQLYKLQVKDVLISLIIVSLPIGQ